jgi:hypothetical protein
MPEKLSKPSYMLLLLALFHYYSDCFYCYCIISKLPVETAVWVSVCSLQEKATCKSQYHFKHQLATSGIIAASTIKVSLANPKSPWPIQALTQWKQQRHLDRLSGCMEAILHKLQNKTDL